MHFQFGIFADTSFAAAGFSDKRTNPKDMSSNNIKQLFT